MRDFFVLFAQPRQPWLDANALKEKYHELTRRSHPDVRRDEGSKAFEEINEGYQVLSDPKQRVEHLLALEGDTLPPRDRTLPADLQEYFSQIGNLRHAIQRVFAEIGDITSALKISLLKNDLLRLKKQLSQILGTLTSSYDECMEELRRLNDVWKENRREAIGPLQVLHDRMAYLSRWIAQLKEIELQFSLRS
jgi:curved DNA-binding protein CbpA